MRRFVLSLSAVAAVAVFGPAGFGQLPPRPVIAQSGIAPPPASLQTGTAPAVEANAAAEPGERVYPISLGAALKLAGGRPLDVRIADQQVTIAARQLDRAKLLWVPNVVTGFNYFRHEGGQQNFAGDILRSSRGTVMVGVGPNVVVPLADAVYAPLAAKQDLRARHAFRNTAENDTTLEVLEAYFTVQQARGELAGALVALTRAEEVARKAELLAQGLTPPLEVSRVKVELARRQQAVSAARELWRVASASLVRLLRLEPGTLVEPVEPPFLPVTVIDPASTPDTLIPVALTTRPELAGHQAVVQAALTRLKQEQMRPLIPSLALRSAATNPGGTLGYGGFGGGPNDRTQAFGSRFDIDFQVLWEFQSLGFGNKARVGERRAEHQAAILDLFRTQDRIAAEVSTAFAQAKAASERVAVAEPALREAAELVEKSLRGMDQTKRIGETNVLIVRPQEVVAAVQAFGQANSDLFAAIADYNRAQFRLYRAVGHPARHLAGAVEPAMPAAPAGSADPNPITPTAYSEKGYRLTPPALSAPEEPRRLPPVIARTHVEPVSRMNPMNPPVPSPRPPVAAGSPPALPIPRAAESQPVKPRPPEVVWSSAAPVAELTRDPKPATPPPPSPSAPLPEIPMAPPLVPKAEQPLDWNKSAEKR